ncbi:hypothetical protein [Jiulongibacter sp. NS-SX5]|uniref:hypothetical protein n=1 Tax=Jiulongibacter sp. NS-SX5 TaxID=3463854 RepID=UPI00405999B5
MNLTAQQIDKIKEFLDSQHLNFQEFYDEMLDHLILETEARMSSDHLDFNSTILKVLDEFKLESIRLFDFLGIGYERFSFNKLERSSFRRKMHEVRYRLVSQLIKNISSPYFLLPLFILLIVLVQFHDVAEYGILIFKERSIPLFQNYWIKMVFILFVSNFCTQWFEIKPFRLIGFNQSRSGIFTGDRKSRRTMAINSSLKTLVFAIGCSGLTFLGFLFLPVLSIEIYLSCLVINILLFVTSFQILISEKNKLKTT